MREWQLIKIPEHWDRAIVKRIGFAKNEFGSWFANCEDSPFNMISLVVDGNVFPGADSSKPMLAGHANAIYNWLAEEQV